MGFPNPIVITEEMVQGGIHVLSGDLTMDSGNLVLGDGRIDLPVNPGLSLASNGTDFTLTDGDWVTIDQWSQQMARGNVPLSEGVLTIPIGGVYIIIGHFQIDGLPTGHHMAGRFLVNNIDIYGKSDLLTQGRFDTISCSALMSLNINDTVAFQGLQSTGANQVISGTGITKTFAVWRLG